MKRTVLGLLALLGLSTGGSHGASGDLKPGDPAPPFKLTGSDGKTYDLASFKGKQAVVIAWFPKAFTGGWTAECKSLRESGIEIRKFDVAYFAASCDDVETNTKFAASLDLDFPILSDPDKNVAEAYGVLIPVVRLPNRWTYYIGKDGTILSIDKGVKPGSAGKDLVANLEKLAVPKAAGPR